MKVNNFLAALCIEDLAKIRGVTFKHADRLTRTEAAETLAWAKGAPEIAAALRQRSSAGYKAVMLFKDVVDHFATEHAQDLNGDPVAWPDRPARAPPAPDDPFGQALGGALYPDEAEALQAYAPTNDEYVAAYYEAGHPNHAAVVARTSHLNATVGRAAEAATQADDAQQKDAAKMDAAQQARLDELRAHPAFLDRLHPEHKRVTEDIRKVYEGAPATPGAAKVRSPNDPPAGEKPKTPQERIAALQQNPAYLDKMAPGHGAALQEAREAYAAAYPEPAAQP